MSRYSTRRVFFSHFSTASNDCLLQSLNCSIPIPETAHDTSYQAEGGCESPPLDYHKGYLVKGRYVC